MPRSDASHLDRKLLHNCTSQGDELYDFDHEDAPNPIDKPEYS